MERGLCNPLYYTPTPRSILCKEGGGRKKGECIYLFPLDFVKGMMLKVNQILFVARKNWKQWLGIFHNSVLKDNKRSCSIVYFLLYFLLIFLELIENIKKKNGNGKLDFFKIKKRKKCYYFFYFSLFR